MSKLESILSSIQYQSQRGQHTYSMCNKCNVNSARSQTACVTCLEEELGELVGSHSARKYVSIVKQTNHLMESMEEVSND